MTNKTDQEREAFEECALDEFISVERSAADNGRYLFYETNLMYVAWQAARTPLLEEIAKRDELIKVAMEALETLVAAKQLKKAFGEGDRDYIQMKNDGRHLASVALTRLNAFQTEGK